MIKLAGGLLLGAILLPLPATVAAKTYAQELADRAVAAHPDLERLTLRTTPPGKSRASVVATSSGAAVGKAAGAGCTVDVELQDASRRPVGTLEAQFAPSDGADCAASRPKAEALRDELRRRISHVDNLIENYPFDASIPTHTFAQHLVDEALDRHPDMIIVAIHVAAPTNKDYPIIASNIGRIGKKADDDDMDVIRTAKPKLEINKTGDRFESEGALRDSSGRVIGAVGVVFPYKPGDDRQALHNEAQALRAAWAKRIPDAAALLAPYPPAS